MFSLFGRPRGAAALAAASTIAIVASIAPAYAQEQARTFDIAAQPLSSALIEFSRQSDVLVVADPAVVNGRRAPAVRGSYAPGDALAQLLAGTGLNATRRQDGGFVLAAAPTALDGVQQASSSEPTTDDEIVVTGTRLRGVAPAGSPVQVYDREAIEERGAGTTEQFTRTLSQNLSGVDGGRTPQGSTIAPGTTQNISAATAVDLRGAGVGATLSLLNGRRMPGSGQDGSIVDISMIPFAALDRVEVLTDGASAIYGSDAVAGVVNFVTREDFSGAETTLRYGDTAQGGARESGASHVMGAAWTRGNAMLALEHYEADPLRADQRDFPPDSVGGTQLAAGQNRNSAFGMARFDLSERATLAAEAIYSERGSSGSQVSLAFPPPVISTYENDQRLAGANLGLDYAIGEDWSVRVSAQYSVANASTHQIIPEFFIDGTTETESTQTTFEALADGPIFNLGGGAARASIGVQHRDEGFDDVRTGNANGVGVGTGLERQVSSIFGELYLPLIGQSNVQPWAERLAISLAARYEDYSDFGDALKPKIGVLWSPVSFLDFRASYGESFRAPTLTQLSETSNSFVAFGIPDPFPFGPDVPTILIAGNNAALTPEESKALTGGFDIRLGVDDGTRISLTYFDIDYTNRISEPPFSPFLFAVPELAPFIQRPADPAAVAAVFANPNFLNFGGYAEADIEAIFDGRLENLAATHLSGLDLAVSHLAPTDVGEFTLFADVTYTLDNDIETTPGTPVVSQLNTVFQPIDLRGRTGVRWNHGPWLAGFTLNYVDGYEDEFGDAISAWTTGDVQLGYRATVESGPMSGVSVVLNMQNITDEDPPFVIPRSSDLQPGYDPVNASALGRFTSIVLSKRW